MAKLNSIFPFRGSIGGVTGYRGPDGVDRVRKKSSLDKDRLHQDKAFAASRTAWPYLGMASQAGLAIRHALHPLLKDNKNHATAHRLVGACQKGLRAAHPERTPAVFNFLDAKQELEGFALVEGRSVQAYASQVLVGEPDHGRGLLRVTVQDGGLSGRDLARSGATHLRWRVIVAALPQGPATERHAAVLDSPWFALERGAGAQADWVCDVPFAKFLIGEGQAIVAMAIEVAQQNGAQYVVMASVKGMDILRVIGKGGVREKVVKGIATALAGGGLVSGGLDEGVGSVPDAPGGTGYFEAAAAGSDAVEVLDWEGIVVAGALGAALGDALGDALGAAMGDGRRDASRLYEAGDGDGGRDASRLDMGALGDGRRDASRLYVAGDGDEGRDASRLHIGALGDGRRDASRLYEPGDGDGGRDASRLYIGALEDGRRDASRLYVAGDGDRDGRRDASRLYVAGDGDRDGRRDASRLYRVGDRKERRVLVLGEELERRAAIGLGDAKVIALPWDG